MSNSDDRQIGRDSMFLLADLRIDGVPGEQLVRVRNLSSGGVMAEGVECAMRGQLAWVNLRNLGWIKGTIAWVRNGRCGITFDAAIDPRMARSPLAVGEGTPRFVRPPLSQDEVALLRKI